MLRPVRIEVEASTDRLTARVVGRGIAVDEPNLVALVLHGKRRRIAAVGDAAPGVAGAAVVPAVSAAAFDAEIAGGVVGFLGMLMWDRLHPGWRGPLSLLDRVEARVTIEGYAQVPVAARHAFVGSLPRYPYLRWVVNGEAARR